MDRKDERKISSNFLKVGLLILYFLLPMFACSKLPAEHKVVEAQNDQIRIPLREINDGGAHFFTYKGWGKRVNFLVRTDREGTLRTHFDACYACYKKKKGYRVEGTDLVCNECNERYNLTEEVWKRVGMGCSPIPFKSSITDNELIINLKDIKKGERLF